MATGVSYIGKNRLVTINRRQKDKTIQQVTASILSDHTHSMGPTLREPNMAVVLKQQSSLHGSMVTTFF